jgi:hypothetical protein
MATILPQYRSPGTGNSRLLLGVAAAAALYGGLIAIGSPDFLLPLILPLVLLALAVIWALPESRRAPLRLLETLFFGFFIAMVLWPDYLALDLGGLRGSPRVG